mmetsp:Transcript_69989/g.186534  ORF Transcript_69989/g.186534 Transcript_69989/m.186534 type:complete len:346 (+) Transcript_69989:203-1240(+)
MLSGGIRMHVPHEQHVAVGLAVDTIHGVVKRPVPGNHLALLPLVLLSGDKQTSVRQIARDTQVNVQNVVRRATVGFHGGACSHSKEHYLLILIHDVGNAGLGREPLLQQPAKLWKKLLTLRGEFLRVVQQDSVPGPIQVQKAIGILEIVGILGDLIKLFANDRIMLLKLAADRQSVPGVPWPHRHGPQPLQPNLGGVVHPGPRHSLARLPGGDAVVRQRLGLLEKLLSILSPVQIFHLQEQNLVVQHRASALHVVQVVEVSQALGISNQLATEIQARHNEGPVPLVRIEDLLHHIQIKEQMRHVAQGEEVVGSIQDPPHAAQGRIRRSVCLVLQPGLKVVHAGVH